MANVGPITVEIRFAWWLTVYKYGVLTMCTICNAEPDEEKTLYWARKAVRVKINGKRVKI